MPFNQNGTLPITLIYPVSYAERTGTHIPLPEHVFKISNTLDRDRPSTSQYNYYYCMFRAVTYTWHPAHRVSVNDLFKIPPNRNLSHIPTRYFTSILIKEFDKTMTESQIAQTLYQIINKSG